MTQKQKKILKRNLIGYSFILPNFIGYFLFIFLPVIFTFVLCVMKWDGSSHCNYVASLVAVGAVWNMLFQPEFGPINEFLKWIGIVNPPKWCASTDWAMSVIIIVSVYVLCVAVLTGLHTVSRNFVLRNAKG